MHLDDEWIQRLLHGELRGSADQLARDHLTGCGDCRRRVASAQAEERDIFARLGELDRPIASPDPSRLFAGAASTRFRPMRWAAGLLLVAGLGGVAYAAPGSPVPGIIERLSGWISRPLPPRSERQPASRPASNAGIAVYPGSSMTISFERGVDSVTAEVWVTRGDAVVVRALDGTAVFVSEADRVRVRPSGRAHFEIQIPWSAQLVVVESGGDTVLRAARSRVVTDAGQNANGRYALRLGPPER